MITEDNIQQEMERLTGQPIAFASTKTAEGTIYRWTLGSSGIETRAIDDGQLNLPMADFSLRYLKPAAFALNK